MNHNVVLAIAVMGVADGVGITTIPHPEPNGLDDIFYCDPDALEEVEIEIEE